MTKNELKKVSAAFKKLNAQVTKLQKAIDTFKEVYDPDTVGLEEWKEDLNEIMFDIHADIEDTIIDEA